MTIATEAPASVRDLAIIGGSILLDVQYAALKDRLTAELEPDRAMREDAEIRLQFLADVLEVTRQLEEQTAEVISQARQQWDAIDLNAAEARCWRNLGRPAHVIGRVTAEPTAYLLPVPPLAVPAGAPEEPVARPYIAAAPVFPPLPERQEKALERFLGTDAGEDDGPATAHLRAVQEPAESTGGGCDG